MKTVTEFANELGVTPQAVYKKINQFKRELTTGLKKGDNGKTLITPKGQAFLRDKFQLSCQRVDNELTTRLEQENRELREDLRTEREHNRELNNRILNIAEQMAELTRNNQILLKQEQERNTAVLHSAVEQEPKSLSAKIKNLFTKNER